MGAQSGWDTTRLEEEVMGIGDRTRRILEQADAERRTPLAVAGDVAAGQLGRLTHVPR
ncbi:MAG: hypothetical protein ACYCV7_08980 [Acidimicrobiales bacterium]